MENKINIAIAIFGVLSTMFGAWMAYRTATSAKAETAGQERTRRIQQESETLGWYRNLVEDMKKHEEELEQELANEKAKLIKHDIEMREDNKVLKDSRNSYALAYSELRRIAVKYVPKDVILPEVNGNSTPLWDRNK